MHLKSAWYFVYTLQRRLDGCHLPDVINSGCHTAIKYHYALLSDEIRVESCSCSSVIHMGVNRAIISAKPFIITTRLNIESAQWHTVHCCFIFYYISVGSSCATPLWQSMQVLPVFAMYSGE